MAVDNSRNQLGIDRVPSQLMLYVKELFHASNDRNVNLGTEILSSQFYIVFDRRFLFVAFENLLKRFYYCRSSALPCDLHN